MYKMPLLCPESKDKCKEKKVSLLTYRTLEKTKIVWAVWKTTIGKQSGEQIWRYISNELVETNQVARGTCAKYSVKLYKSGRTWTWTKYIKYGIEWERLNSQVMESSTIEKVQGNVAPQTNYLNIAAQEEVAFLIRKILYQYTISKEWWNDSPILTSKTGNKKLYRYKSIPQCTETYIKVITN